MLSGGLVFAGHRFLEQNEEVGEDAPGPHLRSEFKNAPVLSRRCWPQGGSVSGAGIPGPSSVLLGWLQAGRVPAAVQCSENSSSLSVRDPGGSLRCEAGVAVLPLNGWERSVIPITIPEFPGQPSRPTLFESRVAGMSQLEGTSEVIISHRPRFADGETEAQSEFVSERGHTYRFHFSFLHSLNTRRERWKAPLSEGGGDRPENRPGQRKGSLNSQASIFLLPCPASIGRCVAGLWGVYSSWDSTSLETGTPVFFPWPWQTSQADHNALSS